MPLSMALAIADEGAALLADLSRLANTDLRHQASRSRIAR
jgi:hypothetical protein